MTGFFFSTGDIYEEAAHHNAVFVGRDESGIPRYAHQRGTAGSFRLDVKGSDKAFNFCYRGEGERLFVFEAPIDLLSSLCLFKKDWQKQSYLALGGVGEKALLRFLSDRPNIKTVFLCLDSDEAGNDACSRLAELVPEANVAFAHGQMKERELENIMLDFINGEIDVLVSTTIIETGLDISNANTMIIHDADQLGLSQMYQLRGRVGRSNRMAYAFFAIQKR